LNIIFIVDTHVASEKKERSDDLEENLVVLVGDRGFKRASAAKELWQSHHREHEIGLIFPCFVKTDVLYFRHLIMQFVKARRNKSTLRENQRADRRSHDKIRHPLFQYDRLDTESSSNRGEMYENKYHPPAERKR
jgi:hypothetical protein